MDRESWWYEPDCDDDEDEEESVECDCFDLDDYDDRPIELDCYYYT